MICRRYLPLCVAPRPHRGLTCVILPPRSGSHLWRVAGFDLRTRGQGAAVFVGGSGVHCQSTAALPAPALSPDDATRLVPAPSDTRPLTVLITVPTIEGGAADEGAVDLAAILAGAGHHP